MYNKEITEAENILSKANSNNQNFLTGFEFSIFISSISNIVVPQNSFIEPLVIPLSLNESTAK